ncbi:MAG: hypothetical protein HKN25_05060 [Pyrinomonadaceae bacterium]|nr:hypothetical protein [Pyrinomonadaceae bacterium]
MSDTAKNSFPSKLAFSSSIKNSAWHPDKKPEGYEWWYFDALSDDGSEAIVVMFLDNFILSPHYNLNSSARLPEHEALHITGNGISSANRFPAIIFTYYRDGKPVYRAINEFASNEFGVADKSLPGCQIGRNSFKYESAPYGNGYLLSIDTEYRKNKRIQANFEWLSIESDFRTDEIDHYQGAYSWNLVSPRSDVTGKINILNKGGDSIDKINFRGTGYHDHNCDNRWIPDSIQEWQRGRAHFPDSTVIFCRHKDTSEIEPTTKLILVRQDTFEETDATCEVQQTKRDFYGLKYPSRMQFTVGKKARLRIKQKEVIDSNFFHLRFLSEITLSLNDGKPRKGLGITEHLAPKRLKNRWLDWFVNMRIGRNGKGSFLP